MDQVTKVFEQRRTPKEFFLSKVYNALQEFEETTGVEVHGIEIEREEEILLSGRALVKSVLSRWRLILR
jgi:hypothetical protein